MGDGPQATGQDVFRRVAQRLQTAGLPGHSGERLSGVLTCLNALDAAKPGGSMTALGIEKNVAGRRSLPTSNALEADQLSGYVTVCERAGDFLAQPMTEAQVRRTVSRLLAGYYPADFDLLRQGLNPDEAEASTLGEPRVYVKATRTEGSTLNTVNLYAILPAPFGEAERILVLEGDRMAERTTLLSKTDRVDGVPNLDGRPFTLRVGIDFNLLINAALGDREFTMKVTARRSGEKGAPGESFEAIQEYVVGTGDVKKFDGRAVVRRVGPDRVFIHYQLFADLDSVLPHWLINLFQDSLFLEMAEELLGHVRRG